MTSIFCCMNFVYFLSLNKNTPIRVNFIDNWLTLILKK